MAKVAQWKIIDRGIESARSLGSGREGGFGEGLSGIECHVHEIVVDWSVDAEDELRKFAVGVERH